MLRSLLQRPREFPKTQHRQLGLVHVGHERHGRGPGAADEKFPHGPPSVRPVQRFHLQRGATERLLDRAGGAQTKISGLSQVMKFVDAGGLLLLDSSHEMFHTVSGFITRTIQEVDPSKFSDDEIMRK